MGDDVLEEREGPCPCGNGRLISQLVEHDVWASGRHVRHAVKCGTCEANYTMRMRMGARHHYLLPTAVAEQLTAREKEIWDRKQTLGKLAEDRYATQFVEFVKGLKFRTAMKDVIGNGHESIERFRRRTRSDDEVEAVAREQLRARPIESLARLKVQDAEIEQQGEQIRALKQELATAEEQAEKVEFPLIAEE